MIFLQNMFCVSHMRDCCRRQHIYADDKVSAAFNKKNHWQFDILIELERFLFEFNEFLS